jgi:hypothetical protein
MLWTIVLTALLFRSIGEAAVVRIPLLQQHASLQERSARFKRSNEQIPLSATDDKPPDKQPPGLPYNLHSTPLTVSNSIVVVTVDTDKMQR